MHTMAEAVLMQALGSFCIFTAGERFGTLWNVCSLPRIRRSEVTADDYEKWWVRFAFLIA
jgi:hypothetical protein